MAHQQVQWGTITLHLDNEAFRKGFLDARSWYFLDIYGKKGRAPEEPERAATLYSEDVLRLIAVPDEQGHYHLGAEACEDIAEYLGYLVGYLGGPLAADEAKQYCKEQAQQDELRKTVTV
jgi:hypothetical protein